MTSPSGTKGQNNVTLRQEFSKKGFGQFAAKKGSLARSRGKNRTSSAGSEGIGWKRAITDPSRVKQLTKKKSHKQTESSKVDIRGGRCPLEIGRRRARTRPSRGTEYGGGRDRSDQGPQKKAGDSHHALFSILSSRPGKNKISVWRCGLL